MLGRLFESCHFERESCQVSSYNISLKDKKKKNKTWLSNELLHSASKWAREKQIHFLFVVNGA